MVATAHHLVDLADPTSTEAATHWWSDLTARGGEGMVVKPRGFIARGRKGLVQPAVKCRGREYLRIIYGPEYDAPEHLARLRSRGLGRKRSLAIREFLLGQEALRRFNAAFMKRCSRCWRWRASRLIQGFDGDRPGGERAPQRSLCPLERDRS